MMIKREHESVLEHCSVKWRSDVPREREQIKVMYTTNALSAALIVVQSRVTR